MSKEAQFGDSDSEDDVPLGSLGGTLPPVPGSSKLAAGSAASSSSAATAAAWAQQDSPRGSGSKSSANGTGSGNGAGASIKMEVDDGDDDDDDDDAALALSAEAAAKKKEKKRLKKEKKKMKKEKKKRKRERKERERREAEERDRKRRKKGASSRGSSATKPAKKKVVKVKVLKTAEQMDRAMKAHRWWDDAELPGDQKWETLEHHGVRFAEEYAPHGVKLIYDGKPVDLTVAQEELATYYAQIAVDGPQLGGKPKIRDMFNKNFFKDFKQVMGRGSVVKDFKKCDWGPLREWVAADRERRKSKTKEQKLEAKVAKEEIASKYAYALVDGHIQKLANYVIEPPGLFRGRGEHPKTGTYKTRVSPQSVTINTGVDTAVPRCKKPGYHWGDVIHKNDVTWLAYWQENVMGGTKYVWLAASSSFKGRSDIAKYEKARKLKGCIGKIRKDYEKNLTARSNGDRQRATAMWIIDRLALRAGNEKDEDEADTVGCCSLRVEHLSFTEPCTVTMDFLGKDSMRHYHSYDLTKYGEVGAKVYANLSKFCGGKGTAGKSKGKKKKPSDDVFDELTVSDLNAHLKTLMPGLSAKVFRTYNASETLQNELPRSADVMGKLVKEKEILYNEANRKVAVLCNHQKTVSKAFTANLEKMKDKEELLQLQINELNKIKKLVRKGKFGKIPLKPEAPGKDDAAKKKRERHSHLWKKAPTDKEAVKKRIASWEQKLVKHQLAMKNKDDNKSVALGTSKINYMDPRITVAWCKEQEMPIEKVFAKTLRDKFPWAMSAAPDWRF